MQDKPAPSPGATPPATGATPAELDELYDNPLERLQLLAGDDAAIAAFLDEIDVRSPREREMLAELARGTALARPERLEADHRRVLVGIESLRRHGHHGSRAGASLGPLRMATRYVVELVARYLVVSYVKRVVTDMRNLYWLREMESEDTTHVPLFRRARRDTQALLEITTGREIGIPTFVLGGLLVPLGLSIWRLASGFTFEHWWVAVLVGTVGIAVGLAMSWVVLRGAALARRRIRLSVEEPLRELWHTIGWCGSPPKDQSRRFATVAISLTLGVWIVLPLLVTLSLAT